MKLLLDTHVMIWWLRDDPNLARRAKEIIAHPDAMLMVSVASFWEMSIKFRRGKYPVPGTVLFEEAVASGISIVEIALPHLLALEALDFAEGHKDPFDHLILAQAITENATLVTGDRRLLGYGVRHVRAN